MEQEDRQIFQNLNQQLEHREDIQLINENIDLQENEIYQKYFNNLFKFKGNCYKNWSTNYMLSIDTYSILYNNQLVLYLIQQKKIVYIQLPMSIEANNCRNVFGLKIPQDLGVSGSLIFVFGTNNYAIIHVDPNTYQEQYYQLLGIKLLQNIQLEVNALERIQIVKQLDQIELAQTKQQQYVCTLSFLIGLSQNQKVIRLNIQIAKDLNNQLIMMSEGNYNLLFSMNEQILHQHQLSLKSKITSYITSKLWFGSNINEQEDTQPIEQMQGIKDLHILDFMKAVMVITESNFMLISYENEEKYQELNYQNELNQMEIELEAEQRDILSRQLLGINYLCSDISLKQEFDSINLSKNDGQFQIVLNIYSQKRQIVTNNRLSTSQMLQQSISQNQDYEHIEEVQILLYTISIPVQKNNQQNQLATITASFNQWKRQLLFYDISYLNLKDIVKADSFSFLTIQNSIREVLILEGSTNKIVMIEQSQDDQLSNAPITFGDNKLLLGFQVNQQNNKFQINIFVLGDILKYIIEINEQYIGLSDEIYISVKKQIDNTNRQQIQYNEGDINQQQNIVDSQQQIQIQGCLKAYLYQMLDQYSPIYIQKRVNDGQIINKELEKLFIQVEYLQQNYTLTQIHNEIQNIILENADLKISDNSFSSIQNNIYSEDGLILSTLTKKQSQLEVIINFLNEFRLLIIEQNPSLNSFINDIKIKINIAKILREYQDLMIDKIKSIQNKVQRSQEREMENILPKRLLDQVFIRAAEKLGFDQNVLQSRGTTAMNVVYSYISKIDDLMITLLEVSMNRNLQSMIQNSSENGSQVLHSGSIILKFILNKIIDLTQYEMNLNNQEFDLFLGTMFQNDIFMEKIFKFIEQLSESIIDNDAKKDVQSILVEISYAFMQILLYSGKQSGDDKFEEWKNNLVIFIEKKVGFKEALQFADQFQVKEQLCRIVYDQGKEYYSYIYNGVQKWGDDFLAIALQIVYDQEVLKIKASVQNQNNLPNDSKTKKEREIESLKTVDKQKYSGFIMFDIFEKAYLNQLAQFLEGKNYKLFALLMLRNKQTDIAHQSLRLILEETKLLDTQLVLSSLALTNSIVFQGEDQSEYYKNKLLLAMNQNQTFDNKKVKKQKIDLSFITMFIDQKLQMYNEEQTFNLIFQLIQAYDYCKDESTDQEIMCLSAYAWNSLVMHYDEKAIKKLIMMLPGTANKDDIYTEYEIKQHMENTLLYKLLQKFKNTSVSINQSIKEDLLKKNPELKKGLNFILNEFENLNKVYQGNGLFNSNFNQMYQQQQMIQTIGFQNSQFTNSQNEMEQDNK